MMVVLKALVGLFTLIGGLWFVFIALPWGLGWAKQKLIEPSKTRPKGASRRRDRTPREEGYYVIAQVGILIILLGVGYVLGEVIL